MNTHITQQCTNRILECEFCTESHRAGELTLHLEVCTNFPLQCVNKCGETILRQDMQSHIEDMCSNTLLECDYKKYGCCERVYRNHLDTHNNDNRLLHMEMKIDLFDSQIQDPDILKQEVKFLTEKVNIVKSRAMSLLRYINTEGEIAKNNILDPAILFKIDLCDCNFTETLVCCVHNNSEISHDIIFKIKCRGGYSSGLEIISLLSSSTNFTDFIFHTFLCLMNLQEETPFAVYENTFVVADRRQETSSFNSHKNEHEHERILGKIYLSKRYMKSAARNMTDNESGYTCEQYYYHYQTEISKCIFLLMINFVEVLSAVSFYVLFVLRTYKYDPTHITNSSVEIYIENCANLNNTILRDNQLEISAFPLLTIAEAFGNVADMFVAGLGVCLMSYLLKRMKKECYLPNNINIKKFIIILLIVSFIIILTSYFTSFIILSELIFLPFLTINLILFIRYVKKFRQALLQIAFERLAQHGSNNMEMKQCRYFTYTSYCICAAFSLITIGTYDHTFKNIILSGLFFGQCYFPYNIIFNSKIKLPFTDHAMENIVLTISYNGIICKIATVGGIITLISPILFVTFYTWIIVIYRKMKKKYSPQYRYHVCSRFEKSLLTEPLWNQ
ncbi:TNF receptor-associated factor 4-like [Oopsacas minuta]|uniref:TNF receptor-associated factor 4-like n=1 Tax=Oopsacas minuta TaxID=111878 RepID=A0AAV7K4C4_9METZ|nr:TNF receptor-associated factor 4-like [Oopsacas minuta]